MKLDASKIEAAKAERASVATLYESHGLKRWAEEMRAIDAAYPMPRAWLGYAQAFEPAKVARICMDCSDRAAAEAIARARGHEMTHGLCDTCGAVRINQLLNSEQPARA